MKLTLATRTLAVTVAMSAPALADRCPYHNTADVTQQRQAFQIARPDGAEMCFTFPKSAGISAGRITVLTVRPFLEASADRIEVHTTTERTRQRGSATHRSADFSAPEILGGAQIFLNADDASYTTVRVRPRHVKDYRLIVVAHEIDVLQVITAASIESLAAMLVAELMEQTFGTDRPSLPFLDERIQHAVLKAVVGAAKGHSPEQIGMDVTLGILIKQALAGHDLPRPARIAITTFSIHIWRELSRGAMARYEWTLPDDVRDTSRPLAAALRN